MRHDGRGSWFVNGKSAEGHVLDPFLTLERDASHVLQMTNATAFHHPVHLHGHSFRVITRDGNPTERREWQDTMLIAPRERVEIAFVADNPGDWIVHCHILEHQHPGPPSRTAAAPDNRDAGRPAALARAGRQS